eukprot:232265-Chlamydomonas_euryale.AAC.3
MQHEADGHAARGRRPCSTRPTVMQHEALHSLPKTLRACSTGKRPNSLDTAAQPNVLMLCPHVPPRAWHGMWRGMVCAVCGRQPATFLLTRTPMQAHTNSSVCMAPVYLRGRRPASFAASLTAPITPRGAGCPPSVAAAARRLGTGGPDVARPASRDCLFSPLRP